MKSSHEKIACKLSGFVLSFSIFGMLLILLANADQDRISTWIAFTIATLGLVAINIVYMSLINNVFKRLNSK
ncbi:hypothetical protein QQ008_02110 [Fulvivirgaceae bacterium BMA10]|uniref:Uncharacterized protein n=1 Tax=Splendidivirga corallicola TaxID=3051826 RepID=A0ABT8KHE3_9BACT|nr:hypothetical protein [Fulvivirgaceae bacterium BMA10]